MSRPVTLFTGQWADIPFADLVPQVAAIGFDGVELACWGDHFDVVRALAEPDYVRTVRHTLEQHDLGVWSIGAHLVGQAVCDRIDTRHAAILPQEVYGDGEPEGVRRRAAERMTETARAAAELGVEVVTGFTGSSIWHLLYSFPPNDSEDIDTGYAEFAERWTPILEVFRSEGVQFALEVHPTEIAYDFATAARALRAIEHHPSFGFNLDPSHFVHQSLDPVAFAEEFSSSIFHVHIKDVRVRTNGRRSILGSHLPFGDAERGWDFVSPGHGDVDFGELIRVLNRIGYHGPLSIEWEDTGMDRRWGARDALAFVRRQNFVSSSIAFDAAMQRDGA